MKQIKIIKLVESKLLLPNSKAISADVGAGILVPKHFVFSGKICNYFIMAPQQNEKHKYDSLWTDIEDGKLKSAFEKRVLPIGYPTEAIFAEELLNEKETYNVLIFDILQYSRTSKNIITRYVDIINLLKKKKVDDFVIITGSEDEDFLKLFTMLQDTQVLEELKEEKKRLVFVQESGDMFAMGHNEAGANHKKATTFVCEHFKDLLNDPEYHYYGHHALNSGIHIRVFQDFYRNISDNKGIAFSFFENYIRRLKRTTHFDIIITLAFPHDPLDAIGEKLEKPLRMHHFSIDNSKSIEDVAESLVKTKDVGKEILLITDVIYSGKTINDVLAKLQAKGFHINKIVSLTANKQDWGSDLKAEIKEKTEVLLMNELPWWGPNSPKGCLLCNLFGSPPPYGDTAIVERKKPMTKLTSYDFYDFLKQTNAVERNKKTLKRNNYNFFFETSKIFLSFATHISRILVKQYGEEMKEAGLIVCPVDNNCSSILFAMHMSKKLGNLSIIPVSRGDIDAWKTYQENNLDGYAEIAGKNILLIDDGINTGATKNNLTRLCIAAGAKNVIGICVFLNRLSIELVEHMRLEKEVLWYFYHWPCPPIKNLEVG